MGKLAVVLLAVCACATHEIEGRHVGTVADGIWLEIRSAYRPEAFAELRRSDRLFFCSDKTGKAICTPAECITNSGDYCTP